MTDSQTPQDVTILAARDSLLRVIADLRGELGNAKQGLSADIKELRCDLKHGLAEAIRALANAPLLQQKVVSVKVEADPPTPRSHEFPLVAAALPSAPPRGAHE